jgi:ribosomal protein S18 acetylase RimI-like enzyme
MNSRAYTSDADLEAITRLISAVRPPEASTDYPSVRDLRDLLSMPEMQAAARLWEAEDGCLAAFALVDSVNNLLFEIDPLRTTPELENQVVAWGMSRVALVSNIGRDHPALDVSCQAENTARKRFLERQGFQRVPGGSVRMVRSLADPIPAPDLPPGFTIRPLAGEKEIEAYVALHQAAFSTRNMTVDHRRAIMRAPGYLPEMDLVAIAPDGTLAALCVCQITQELYQNSSRSLGWTDPVATHPSYRRLGLARALLLTGLDLLRERGLVTGQLTTNSDNTAMMRLASETGFCVASAIDWYSKPVGP